MHFEGRIDLQNAPVFIIRGYGTTSIRTLICLYEALLFLRILIARLHSHHAGVVLKSNYSDMRVRHACRAVPQSAGAFGGHQHSKFRVILFKN